MGDGEGAGEEWATERGSSEAVVEIVNFGAQRRPGREESGMAKTDGPRSAAEGDENGYLELCLFHQ